MRTSRLIFLVFFSWLPLLLAAQRDTTLLPLPNNLEDMIEDFIQNSDDEDFDFNDLFQTLEYLQKKPLNLNKATREDLEGMFLLSDIQINDFLSYRATYGDLIAVQELQSIPSFDLQIINDIRPFVKVRGGVDDYQVPILEMMAKGRNEILARWLRRVETARGYRAFTGFLIPIENVGVGEPEFGEPELIVNANPYAGDANGYYFRFKHQYENRLSYGVTMEKDAGEDFFTGSNRQGFDFYSAHFHLKNYSKRIKDLVVGDYQVSFGQGLILYTGFGRGKGTDAMGIKRGQRTLRGYSSVNEINFYRGAGITVNVTDHVEATVFGSIRNRDGNLSPAADTLENDGDIAEFTSLQTSGLHRTKLEIDDENAIQQTVLGGNIKYHNNRFQIGLNALYNRLDKTLTRNFQPYSQFYFSGDRLFNASIDYSYVYQNINIFGETAMSDNGAVATTNGVLLGLDRKIDLSLLYRDFPRDYQALDPNVFAESRNARNERGLYIGTVVRPIKHFTLSAYFDLYQHPWLQFDADAPSSGYDIQSRLTYYLKRKITAYVQVKYEVEEENLRGNETPVDILQPFRLFRLRFHFENKLNKTFELRTRLAWGFSKNDVNIDESGWMLYQDLIYKPKGFPLSFTTRLAYFDTPSFNVRFYAYENDLLNSFSVPPYYNKGTRFYVNLRYKGIRNLTLEARFAQTYWRGEEGFSLSTTEEILGPTRTDVRAQVKFVF